MDAQQFLAEFKHIAHAPEGVAKLREMIYQLAVTGSLTPRSEAGDNAGDLLIGIEVTRQRLILEKKYKCIPKLENEPVQAPSDVELPQSWRWTRLLDIGEINPRNQAPDEEVAAFIPMRGIPQFHHDALVAETRKWGEIKRGYTHFANGDVILAKITPCFENGKSAAVSDIPGDLGIGAGTTELHVFRPVHEGVLPDYVYIYLRSPFFTNEGKKSMTGTAGQKRLSVDYFATRAFPLPPTEEQGRIVAKVDELMALCDKLEMQKKEYRRLQNALRQATLKTVSSAGSPHELQESWATLEENFEQLFSAPEDVKQLKGTLLDLAVSGRLFPRERWRECSGLELLESISNARRHWAECSEGQEYKEAKSMLKKLRAQHANVPASQLPEHWAWATLLQVSQAVVDCHNKTAPYVTDGIPLVRTTDICDGQMNLSNTKRVSEETYAYWARRMPPKSGDIFFSREAPMGEAAIVPEGEKVCLGQRMMLIRLFPSLFNNRFLLYVILSPSFQEQMLGTAVGMAVKHLRVGGVEGLMVPVPPKPEQDQIVEAVDYLFEICDAYTGQLNSKQKKAETFAMTAVSTLTGITTGQEEEQPVKAPHTELVAKLCLGQTPDIKTQAPLATVLARHDGEMSAKNLWQRFGGEIDAFYAQLKTEISHGWILEPEPAEVREVGSEEDGA
ncbi:type I restriction enzyme S subunit [Chromohalobacter marismortui]|uniref:Type I restriction enzyme S subunit n=2 Tax=Chromohalobacter TaxID=42054 RepID=A0A4R7NS90_9GAMM|nr:MULTISPECIES: restriction endonuclease subunit S [Chromohalobacter]MCI0509213.1 restriction endonuclease subunit S [Chromohalobacter sp.]TDU23895.1 type I restriction enzyme S subunit [Chromohalobacter marismortui]